MRTFFHDTMAITHLQSYPDLFITINPYSWAEIQDMWPPMKCIETYYPNRSIRQISIGLFIIIEKQCRGHDHLRLIIFLNDDGVEVYPERV